MLRENVVGDTPHIDSTSFVDPSAVLIGKVDIGHNCYIGPSVVIRADRFSTNDDTQGITVADNCAIQDLAVLHTHAGESLIIKQSTVINHGAVIHGPSVIGASCFIGCKTVITHADIGDTVFVRSNAIVENVVIPPERFVDVNMIVNSQEAVAELRSISEEQRDYIMKVLDEHREYPLRFKYSLDH